MLQPRRASRAVNHRRVMGGLSQQFVATRACVRFVRRAIDAARPRRAARRVGARDGLAASRPPTSLRVGFGAAVGRDRPRRRPRGRAARPSRSSAAHDARRRRRSRGLGRRRLRVAALRPRRRPARLDVPRVPGDARPRDGTRGSPRADGAERAGATLARRADAPVQETQSLRSLDLPAHRRGVRAQRRAAPSRSCGARRSTRSCWRAPCSARCPKPSTRPPSPQRLRAREPICTIYGLPTTDGRRFVGASPELLVRRTGARRRSATRSPGTIALPANVDPDDYQTWLLGSAKNLHEHAVLGRRDRHHPVGAYYDDIDADATPSIVALRTVAHLGTWISGERHARRRRARRARRCCDVLAPDGGRRRGAARRGLRAHRAPRAARPRPLRRAGRLGRRRTATASGGSAFAACWSTGATSRRGPAPGIVSESDPIAEREETRDKLASVLSSVLVDRV